MVNIGGLHPDALLWSIRTHYMVPFRGPTTTLATDIRVPPPEREKKSGQTSGRKVCLLFPTYDDQKFVIEYVT